LLTLDQEQIVREHRPWRSLVTCIRCNKMQTSSEIC